MQYYKVKKKYRDYKGRRLFKFNPVKEKVLQICISFGERKTGRANLVGIYTISRVTFLSNYRAIEYTEKCTKREFDNAFKRILEKLKNEPSK
jgi:hypothetical protein